MSENQKHIEKSLRQYKVRFVRKRLLEGLIVLVSTLLLTYLLISGLEAIGRFNSWIRGLLLIGYLTLTAFVLFIRVGRPLMQLLNAENAIKDEDAARRLSEAGR